MIWPLDEVKPPVSQIMTHASLACLVKHAPPWLCLGLITFLVTSGLVDVYGHGKAQVHGCWNPRQCKLLYSDRKQMGAGSTKKEPRQEEMAYQKAREYLGENGFINFLGFTEMGKDVYTQ